MSPSIATSVGPAPNSVLTTRQIAAARITVPPISKANRGIIACCLASRASTTLTIGPIVIVPTTDPQPGRTPRIKPMTKKVIASTMKQTPNDQPVA